MRAKHMNVEKRKLSVLCDQQAVLLKTKDEEIEKLRSELTSSKVEATEAGCLRTQVSTLKSTESSHAIEVTSLKEQILKLEVDRGSLSAQLAELHSSMGEWTSVLEEECNSLSVKMSELESPLKDKDHEIAILNTSI